MNQKTCYLYQYKSEQKVKNVGFLKLQRQDTKIKIHINGKGLAVKNEESFHFNMFYAQEDRCMAALLGQVKGKSGNINCIVDIDENQLPKGMNFDQMDGVIIELENGNKYAAAWNSVAINVDNIVAIKDSVPDHPAPGDSNPADEEFNNSEKEYVKDEAECEAECNELKDVQPAADAQRRYQKIQRQEIAQLQRKEWKLANNSFLLHGYYNYHHLVLIEEYEESEEILWLGVPGIFHVKEQTVAKHFGFHEFKRIDPEELNLEAKERNEQEEFGYWCRQVNRCECQNQHR